MAPKIEHYCPCLAESPHPPAPQLASSAYSFHALHNLFFCEECDAVRCGTTGECAECESECERDGAGGGIDAVERSSDSRGSSLDREMSLGPDTSHKVLRIKRFVSR